MKKLVTGLFLLAVVALIIYSRVQSTKNGDFDQCNLASSASYWEDQRTGRHNPVQSFANPHDSIDAAIHLCMLAKGYTFNPGAWEKCPVEKLAMCYERSLF